tara:strand:- start:91 stop:201 length:111 start_codon:yes stop_codon:yes gene_type:complete
MHEKLENKTTEWIQDKGFDESRQFLSLKGRIKVFSK